MRKKLSRRNTLSIIPQVCMGEALVRDVAAKISQALKLPEPNMTLAKRVCYDAVNSPDFKSFQKREKFVASCAHQQHSRNFNLNLTCIFAIILMTL
jgi:hypothetical protein